MNHSSRCISYIQWGIFRPAMLVYRRVVFKYDLRTVAKKKTAQTLPSINPFLAVWSQVTSFLSKIPFFSLEKKPPIGRYCKIPSHKSYTPPKLTAKAPKEGGFQVRNPVFFMGDMCHVSFNQSGTVPAAYEQILTPFAFGHLDIIQGHTLSLFRIGTDRP